MPSSYSTISAEPSTTTVDAVDASDTTETTTVVVEALHHGQHDELGMETTFTVGEGAATLAPLPGAPFMDEAPREAGTSVMISQFAFEPAELSVSVGSTVTWNNDDPTTHTVTGDDFDTGPIEPGASGSVTFDEAGSFDYFCSIHPSMQGRVVVGP